MARFDAQAAELDAVLRKFLERYETALLGAAAQAADSLARGGKVLFFGNGGSAAEAQHFAAELINRMTRDRPALAGIALSTDGSSLTSIANDSSYDRVFARQIEALGRAGDVALALSTSGSSPNILQGLETARRLDLATVAFLGRDGGKAASLADCSLIVESDVTARIQEVHLFAGHLYCEAIEERLYPRGGVAP